MNGFELDQDDQAAWHQLMLERQEQIEYALLSLARGIGGEREINLLANELKVPSPYERESA